MIAAHGGSFDLLLGRRTYPPRSFELVSTKAMPSGIIFSHYKVAGPLKTG
jgi:hypothetical protein